MAAKQHSSKLVLLGDAAVGKSSTVERFVKGEFFDFQQPTIGASFFARQIRLQDGTTIKFEIWDTAGQERYRTLAPMYYRGAASAVVVYDITESDSFKGAKTYIEELKRQCSPDLIIALVGNKVDLDENREVWVTDAQAYAEEQGCLFFECSAKTGENVNAIFETIGEQLPKDSADPNQANIINIVPDDKEPSKGCC